MLGSERLARVVGGQRRGERFAAHAQLAGRPVERRKEELLGDLLDALGRGPLARRARVGHRRRLIAGPAGGEVGGDEHDRGNDRSDDKSPLKAAPRGGVASLQLDLLSAPGQRDRDQGGERESSGDQERGAERGRRGAVDLRLDLVAEVDGRGGCSGSVGNGSNAGPITGTLSPSA